MAPLITQAIAATMFIAVQLHAAQQCLNAQKEQSRVLVVSVQVMLIPLVIVVEAVYKVGLSGPEIPHARKPAQQ
jgi:hypothetical protein